MNLFMLHTVGQGSGQRIVHETQHFKAGQLSGRGNGQALGVIETSRSGHQRSINRFTEMSFGVTAKFSQRLRQNLRRGVRCICDRDVNAGLPLRAGDNVIGYCFGYPAYRRVVDAPAGAVAEFLAYSGKLAEEERKGVEEYLRRKWLSEVYLISSGASVEIEDAR